MSLGDDVRVSEVQFGLKGDNVELILKNLSWKISQDINFSAASVRSDLKRIAAYKPGIGDGIAVFDWLSEGIEEPYVLVSRLEHPVDIQAIDDRPVDFILVLVSPDSQSVTHLRHLSRLTRMFRDVDLLDQLRSTQCEDGMRAVLSPENRQVLAA